MNYLNTPSVLVENVAEYGGCPLHYWITPDMSKPPVVMMHGATMDHRMFNDQVNVLADDYSLLVWDARGHGKSQPSGNAPISMDVFVDDMLHILDIHNIETFIPMGQSLGGYIAQYLYKRVPERIDAMIVIGSTPIAKAYSRFDMWALKASLPIIKLIPYNSFAKMVAQATATKEPVQSYALEAVRAVPREEFSRIWSAVMFAVDANGLPDFRIDCPLLLVHGDQDKTGSIKRDMPSWYENEPHAEFHIIPNAGHNANQDNPEQMNQLVIDFLARHIVTA